MALTFTVPKLRMWHLIGLVAVVAVFLSVFQYRAEVGDPNRKLVRALRNGETAERLKAGRQLQARVDLDDAVVDAFLAALHDESPMVRSLAAQALGYSRRLENGDPKASIIMMALKEALRDPVDSVRYRVASSIVWFDTEASFTVPVLIEALKSPDTETRIDAALAIGRFIQENPEAREAEIAAASDPEWGVRATALQGMVIGLTHPRITRRRMPQPAGPGHPGSAKPPIPHIAPMPMLERAFEISLASLEDSNPTVRTAAATNIYTFAAAIKPKSLDPRLIASLDDPEIEVRIWILDALRGYSTRTRRTVPLLIRALTDPSQRVRAAAVRALGQLGVWAEGALPALVRAKEELRSSKEGEVGIDSEEMRSLNDVIERIRKNILVWRTELFPDSMRDLDNFDDDQRRSAAEILGTYGALAREAVPKLRTMAESDVDEQVRLAATRSLKMIEADEAATTVPRSSGGVNDPSARATPEK